MIGSRDQREGERSQTEWSSFIQWRNIGEHTHEMSPEKKKREGGLGGRLKLSSAQSTLVRVIDD